MIPTVFWALTYYEFYLIYKGHIKREIHEKNKMLFTAWNTAYFTRANRLPTLKEILHFEEEAEQKEQTPEQILTVIKVLNAMLGGDEVITK